MSFQKGKSGNPGGRSTEKAYTDALRAAVNMEHPVHRRRKLLLIADKVTDLAVEGEGWAVAHVADRLDGKSIQDTNLTIERRSAVELSDNELLGIAAGSGEDAVAPPLDPSKLN